MKKAPKWVLDPAWSFIHSASLFHPNTTLALSSLWRASHSTTFHESVRAQAALMQKTHKATEALIKDVDGEDFIQRDGQLQLYGNEKQYRESALDRKHKLEQGIEFIELKSAGAIADIQPGVHSSFTHGIYTPKWMNVVDPKKWVEHLAKTFVLRGGKIEIHDAVSLVHFGRKTRNCDAIRKSFCIKNHCCLRGMVSSSGKKPLAIISRLKPNVAIIRRCRRVHLN